MRSLTLCALTLLLTGPLAAQDQHDSSQRVVLRDRIEQNFLARAKEELALNDEQSTKLMETTRRTFQRRRTMEMEYRRLNQVLANEMRPGVAADQRVLRRTLDSLVTLRVATAEIYREEQRELAGFLTDVQRAQYHVMRERFLDRVENVRASRAPRPAPPPRARPR